MPDLVKPSNLKEKTTASVPPANVIETVFAAHPPLVAWSETSGAAVSGTNTASGSGVYGKSAAGDGVHGESAGANMSAVAGLHSAGGNGIYGKSATGNAGSFDGNVLINGNLTVAKDIYLVGADCAEQFEVSSCGPVEPGTLMVIDANGGLEESGSSYDRKVAGVVAGAGSYRPGIILDSSRTGNRATISLMGKAYCKVDADYAPVEIGDLLTSSSTPGCAMKALDAERAFGAVIGKALQPLASGRGIIPILLALQ
jgi:hypothetical protein